MEPPKVCELSEVRQLMLMPPRDRGCSRALMELCFEECGGGCTGVERGDEAGGPYIRKVRGYSHLEGENGCCAQVVPE